MGMKHDKVIGIPHVIALFKRMLHKLVELIEINIGKKLGSKITDRNTFWLKLILSNLGLKT